MLQLLKKLKGEKPESVKDVGGGELQIEMREGSRVGQIVVNKNVYQLYLDPAAREATQRALAPLRNPGIDTFGVVDGKKPIELVRREDLPYFEAPEPIEPPSEDVAESTYVAAYEIVKPSFENGLKWMLSDGQNHFSADVDDEAFLKRLGAREVSFTKGDILKVQMHSKSTRSSGGLKTQHRILRVLDHKRSPQQASLPPASGEDGEDE